jgi:hypothetical protein
MKVCETVAGGVAVFAARSPLRDNRQREFETGTGLKNREMSGVAGWTAVVWPMPETVEMFRRGRLGGKEADQDQRDEHRSRERPIPLAKFPDLLIF